MNKGDLFTVYMEGAAMTVCVLGFYEEEYSGEEMVILAVVNQDNMVYVPLTDLEAIFPRNKKRKLNTMLGTLAPFATLTRNYFKDMGWKVPNP